MLCDLCELAPSSYHYQAQKREQADLRAAIEQIALEFPRYGYRRVAAQLKRQGIVANRKESLPCL